MKKNALILVCVAVAGISAYTAHRANSVKDWTDDLLPENAEALADNESGGGQGNVLWFSNLRNVRCTTMKKNYIAGFIYRGMPVAVGGEYTYYGSQWKCEREVTINTCNTSNETSCE